MRSDRCHQPEVHFFRVADEVSRDLPGDVHVEALQFRGFGIAKTEQVGALVQPDDQPAAVSDRLHGRARFGEGRKLAVASQLSTAAPDADGAAVAPLGIGSVVSEADTSTSGCTLEQRATRVAASTNSAVTPRISGTR